MSIQQQIADLQRQISVLSARIDQRPIMNNVYVAEDMVLTITGGNTLETGQDGINYASGTISSVPSAYNPNVDTTFIDGIGRGVLYKNGVAQTGYVLIVNDDRGTFRNALLVTDGPITTGSVLIAGPGGTFVTAYTVG